MPRKLRIKFIQAYGRYNIGDYASISPSTAQRLLNQDIAIEVDINKYKDRSLRKNEETYRVKYDE